jgi:hypothetical protein
VITVWPDIEMHSFFGCGKQPNERNSQTIRFGSVIVSFRREDITPLVVDVGILGRVGGRQKKRQVKFDFLVKVTVSNFT